MAKSKSETNDKTDGERAVIVTTKHKVGALKREILCDLECKLQ